MQRVLIANRGEIALRIMRACHAAGLEVVCVYTRADSELPYLHLADDTVCVGATSYLDIANLIMAAKATGCDAIHPGYGFLSENPEFATAVEAQGLVFIGPTPASIRDMADKARARQIASDNGLTPVPGSVIIQDPRQLTQLAAQIGFPLMLKASAGGGGRGIRVVSSGESLQSEYLEATAEADAAFGDGAMYAEKFIERARHIEVQVVGDGEGGGVHLGTRECSVQRRQQKVLEEAPAPFLDQTATEKLLAAVVGFVKATRYRGAGTVEFLFADNAFYFIEMNTRLQVEHPVTEMVTGVDLVAVQLGVAAGSALPPELHNVEIRGHALECRINAEDEQFSPSPGLIESLSLPGGPGIRIDTHVKAGYLVPYFYDSMIAKLIAHGSDRPAAIARMSGALDELHVSGIATNRNVHRRILEADEFLVGSVDTGFFERSIAGQL